MDNVVKVHANLEGHLAIIEGKHSKAIETRDDTDLTYYEARWELEKLQKAYHISQLDHAASMATLEATLTQMKMLNQELSTGLPSSKEQICKLNAEMGTFRASAVDEYKYFDDYTKTCYTCGIKILKLYNNDFERFILT